MSSSTKFNNLPIGMNTSDHLDIISDEDSLWSENSNLLDFSSDDSDDGYKELMKTMEMVQQIYK